MTRRSPWPLLLPALAWPGWALAADDGWSSRQLLLLVVVGVSVVLAGVAYLRIARKALPVPPPVPQPEAPAPAPAPAPTPTPTPTSADVTSVVMTPAAAAALATASRTLVSATPAAAGTATDLLLEPAPMVELQVELRATHGPLAGQVFTLPTPNGALAIAVGRDAASCQLVLPNELDTVGRLHAMLIWNPESCSLVVEDASSGHGTFVNARRIAPHEATALHDGDVVDLGGAASNRLSVRLRAADDPYSGALTAGARWIGVQCSALGHLHFAEPGRTLPCPICTMLPHPTLVTRARQEPKAAAATTITPGLRAAGDMAPVAIEPAVGWLMCTQGPDRGRDFRLVAGDNAIGRADDMPVCLAGDSAVQRQQHAVVEYDAARRFFVLRPGAGRGLAYLNGQELKTAVPLKAQDRIELGTSTLVFVPLSAPGEAAAMDLSL